MSKPVRFGLIGCSDIARRRFVPAVQHTSLAQVVMAGSRSRGRASMWASDAKVQGFGTYDDVLANAEVDAVYVSTPPTEHGPWVLKALEAGKHVICEKVAFMSLAEAEKAVALAKENGLRLAEAYVFPFHPQHQWLKEVLDKKEIGDVKVISSEFIFPRPANGNYRLNPAIGGGTFWDAAGYPLALALRVWGLPVNPSQLAPNTDASVTSPKIVQAVSCRLVLDPASKVDALAHLAMQGPGESLMQAVTGFGCHYQNAASITGTLGRIEMKRVYSVNGDAIAQVLFEKGAHVEKKSFGPKDQFLGFIEAFAAAVSDSTQKASTFWSCETELLDRARLMDAALKSSKANGTWQSL